MSKKISPEDITKIIQPGSRIFIGTGCSEPIILTSQLVLKKHHFTDCEILHFLTLSDNNFFDSQSPPCSDIRPCLSANRSGRRSMRARPIISPSPFPTSPNLSNQAG
jgi:acyl-CoA hydrolase